MKNRYVTILKAMALAIGVSHMLGCGVVPRDSSIEAFMEDDDTVEMEQRSRLDSMPTDKAVMNDSGFEPAGEGRAAHDRPDDARQVLVNANNHVSRDVNRDEAESARCLADANSSFSYRKRIGVLPMVLQQRQDAVDIPYVEREYAQALVRRLGKAGQLMPLEASHYHSLNTYSPQSRMHSPASVELIRRTAKDLNVQFLVAGRLLDLSFDRTSIHAVDLVTSLQSWKNLGRQIYRRGTGSYWRQMHLELSIFDGPSGLLLKRQRYNGAANHVINGQRPHRSKRSGLGDIGLETGYFWQSDYGQLISRTLDEQVTLINRTTECLPLRAQVVGVHDEMIEIDIGIDSRVMPGDRLRVFHKEPAGLDAQGVPSYRWQYYGTVTIVGVSPLKSVAQLDKNLPADIVAVGDIVQAW